MNLHKNNNKEVLFDPFFISFNLKLVGYNLEAREVLERLLRILT